MPHKVSEPSGYSLTIADDFDETKSYPVRLFEVEDKESTFPESKNPYYLAWKMNAYRDDGSAFEDTRTGLPYDIWATSPDYLAKGSKARNYLHTFMGKELEDAEVDELVDQGFSSMLEGKTAIASFQIVTNDSGYEQIKVLAIRPSRAPERARQPAPPTSVGAARRQARLVEE